MVLVVLVLLGVIGAGVAASSHRPDAVAPPPPPQQVDQIRADIAQQRQECFDAQRNPGAQPYPQRKPFPPGFDCNQIDPAQVRVEDFLPHTFSFRAEAPQYLLVFGGLLSLFAFAVGASFVGAEWSSGAMMNLLTWRPRRVNVLLSKLTAALSATAAIGVVCAGLWLAALYAIAQIRGQLGVLTAGIGMSLALDVARVLALALAAGAMGFALASLGRHTATALGVAIGWVLVMEVGLRIVLLTTEVPRPERWFVSSYTLGWLTKKATFEDFSPCRNPAAECRPIVWSITMTQAAIVLGAAVLAGLVAAVVTMSRRDVT
jgi:ABC-type transport system involved in multi-copper enzyme maturation permease subunit